MDFEKIVSENIKSVANLYLTLDLKDLIEDVPSFYLGGGCFKFNKYIKDCDLDLFPIKEKFYALDIEKYSPYKTKNAQSLILKNGRKVQLCNYLHDSMEDLIRSFDFSHCQCGVKVVNKRIEYVFFTDEYIQTLLTKNVVYTGSEYPLSSLMRAGKLYKNDHLNFYEFRSMVCDILYDIAKRGFADYDDLRDQLDAIDLQYNVGSKHYRLVDVLPGKDKS